MPQVGKRMSYAAQFADGTSACSSTVNVAFSCLYDLRHSFISHMVEAGVSLGLIQGMVGHISKKMVLHHTHVTSGAARKAVELLDAEPILTPSLKPERLEVIQ